MNLTPLAIVVPLLPISSCYFTAPRHTCGVIFAAGVPEAAGARLSGLLERWSPSFGHDRAQTGSEPRSSFVIVRSNCGRIVVTSDAVLLTPWFLTFPVTVAVLKIDEPADCSTVPVIVIACVPPEFSDLSEHFTCGAITTQPPVVPTVPLTTVCDAVTLAASSPCVLSVVTTSSARLLLPVALFVTRIL